MDSLEKNTMLCRSKPECTRPIYSVLQFCSSLLYYSSLS